MRSHHPGNTIFLICGVLSAVGATMFALNTAAGATSPPPPTIAASAEDPGGGEVSEAPGGADEGGSNAAAANCTSWSPMGGEFNADTNPWKYGGGPGADAANAALEASADGRAQYLMRYCNGAYEWQIVPAGASPTVTVDDLVPGVLDEVRRTIPAPVLDMSPGADVGGIVNVGLWLAIAEPAPVTARAEAGSVWAQAQATLGGLTWDMGNGDVVECAGFGDPIVDEDTLEPSPVCGYNYDQPSTPQFTGGGDAYPVSVTAHWDVRVTGSDGRDVAADPIDVPLAFDYVVSEVQTIGN